MRFRTTIELQGTTATGLAVPPDVVAALGSSQKPAVVVSLAGYAYRTTVAARGDRFLVPLSGEHRAAAGVGAGDVVDVDVVLDTEPREVAVPADLAKALEDAGATERFAALAFSRRKEWARTVEEATAPETRQRRIAKAVASLTG